MISTERATPARSKAKPLLALLLSSLLAGSLSAAVAVAGGGGGGGGGDVRAQVLGQKRPAIDPACSGDLNAENRDCRVVGSVTAFQARIGKKAGPFRVPQDGRIVAWSVDLGRLNATESSFFGDLFRNRAFGRKPSANIAVIKKVGGGEFRLRGKSSAVDLSGYAGRSPIFAIADPLRAREGDVVALSVPTWVSAFAFGAPAGGRSVWKASLKPDNCAPDSDTQESKEEFAENAIVHTKVGSTREYGCKYVGARVLYRAYYVPDKG